MSVYCEWNKSSILIYEKLKVKIWNIVKYKHDNTIIAMIENIHMITKTSTSIFNNNTNTDN